MVEAAALSRGYVNNGGDIAMHLARGHRVRLGLARPAHAGLHGTAEIGAADGVRGAATSGWPGRSHSLGIADAVTVLAGTASLADAAATVIANAVDLPGHAAITRVPARALAPDSDLGDRLVTRAVGPLQPDEIERALDAGLRVADALRRQGLIAGAALNLQGVMALTPALSDGEKGRMSMSCFAAVQQNPMCDDQRRGGTTWPA